MLHRSLLHPRIETCMHHRYTRGQERTHTPPLQDTCVKIEAHVGMRHASEEQHLNECLQCIATKKSGVYLCPPWLLHDIVARELLMAG